MALLHISCKDDDALYTQVDDDLYKDLQRFSWWASWKGGKSVYVLGYDSGPGRVVALHRFIMNCPKGMVVDHINHDTLDNRRENLRICTVAQNQWNRVKDRDASNPSKNIVFEKETQKYRVRIIRNGRVHRIGRYKTPEEAMLIRDSAIARLHGRFAFRESS